MLLPIQAERPPLVETEDGVVRIAGTRIPLERVVRAFLNGMTPEQIVHDFDVLSVEDVYAVVNYYLHHRGEVDAYLAAAERQGAEIRAEIEQSFDSAGIRARLMARDGEFPTLAERLKDVIGILDDMPEDAALNHDHFVRGAPKLT